jgi:RHS repeat-associated protein
MEHDDTGALTQNLRFPGQWFQAETGLHQNWMRDYDPTTGRYLQADPLGLVDGPSVYGYARQSPLRFTDPTGEFIPPPLLGAIVGGVSSIAIQFFVNLNNTGDVSTALKCIDFGKVLAGAAFGAIGFTPFAALKQGGGLLKIASG